MNHKNTTIAKKKKKKKEIITMSLLFGVDQMDSV